MSDPAERPHLIATVPQEKLPALTSAQVDEMIAATRERERHQANLELKKLNVAAEERQRDSEGRRSLGFVVVLALVSALGFLLYRSQYVIAEKLLIGLAGALSGYLAGRAHEKLNKDETKS